MARVASIVLLASVALCDEVDLSGLVDRLGSPDAHVRLAAMEEVDSLSEEQAFTLTAQVPSLAPEVGMRIWRAIARAQMRHDPSYCVAFYRYHPNLRQVECEGVADPDLMLPRLAEIPPERRGYALTPGRVALADLGWQENPPADDGATDPILSLARHPSAEVRARVAGMLGRAESPVARRTFAALMRDRAAAVRLAALWSSPSRLERRADMHRAVLPLLADPCPRVREEATVRLVWRAGPMADLALYSQVWDPDPRVREAAGQYFLERGGPWAFPLAVRAFGGRQDHELWWYIGQRDSVDVRDALCLADALPRLPRRARPVALALLQDLARRAQVPGPALVPLDLRGLRVSSSPSLESASKLVDGFGIGSPYKCIVDSTLQSRGAGLIAIPPKSTMSIECAEGARPVAIAFDTFHHGTETLFIERSMDGATFMTVGEYILGSDDHAVQPIPLGGPAKVVRWTYLGRSDEMESWSPWRASEVRMFTAPEDPVAAWTEWARAVRAGTYALPNFDPGDPSAHRDRALALRAMHDFRAAEEEIAVAIALSPCDLQLRFMHGVALRALGRHADAAMEFGEAAVSEEHGEEAYYRLACEQALTGDLDGALDSLRMAAWVFDGVAERARGDPDFRTLRNDPRFEESIKPKPDRGR